MPPSRTGVAPRRTSSQGHSLGDSFINNPVLSSLFSEFHEFDLSRRLKVGQWQGGGGYADVYDGNLRLSKLGKGRGNSEYVKVAVKRFRPFSTADDNTAGVRRPFTSLVSRQRLMRIHPQSISRELKVLMRVKHKNIVRFWGFTSVDGVPSFVFDWMENGTLRQYMKNNHQVDKSSVVCVCISPFQYCADAFPQQAIEIAKGLEYLHSNGVVHSDLKSVSLYTLSAYPDYLLIVTIG